MEGITSSQAILFGGDPVSLCQLRKRCMQSINKISMVWRLLFFHFSKEEQGYLNPVSSSTSNWLGVSIEATGTTYKWFDDKMVKLGWQDVW